jgi:asparagine N-glycosylation enzyme membrane subunit Stt3
MPISFEVFFWAMIVILIFAVIASVYSIFKAFQNKDKNKIIYLITLAFTWIVVFLSIFLTLSLVIFISEETIPF